MSDGEDAPLRKDFKLELSKFRAKTKPTLAEALALRMEQAELLKAKDAEADAARLKAIDLSLKKLNDAYLGEAESFESRINKLIKGHAITAKDPRGLAKWYADIVDKESGFDLGRDLKLWGEMNFGKKEFKLTLSGKFSNP